MNQWAIVRVALLAIGLLQGALSSQAQAPLDGVTPTLIAVAFAFGIVGLLFVVGIQRINPISAPIWRYPSWSINPFLLREPLQFFHLGGFYFLASGVGELLRQIFLKNPLTLDYLFLPAIGLGLLSGVYLCTVVFRSKMART